MAALQASTVRNKWNVSDFPPAKRSDIVVKAANTIYKGALVDLDSGEMIPATNATGAIGFADDDYAAGEYATAEYDHFLFLDVTGVTGKGNIGAVVYATTDNDFTTSSQTTIVGYVHDYQNGQAIVRITLGQTVV
jgi:hypothetical protein